MLSYPVKGIPIIKIRRLLDRLIFITGIPILGWHRRLYIQTTQGSVLYLGLSNTYPINIMNPILYDHLFTRWCPLTWPVRSCGMSRYFKDKWDETWNYTAIFHIEIQRSLSWKQLNIVGLKLAWFEMNSYKLAWFEMNSYKYVASLLCDDSSVAIDVGEQLYVRSWYNQRWRNWLLNKMAESLQTTLSGAFPWWKIIVFVSPTHTHTRTQTYIYMAYHPYHQNEAMDLVLYFVV